MDVLALADFRSSYSVIFYCVRVMPSIEVILRKCLVLVFCFIFRLRGGSHLDSPCKASSFTKSYQKDSPLVSSGLLGLVRIIYKMKKIYYTAVLGLAFVSGQALASSIIVQPTNVDSDITETADDDIIKVSLRV
jgi:hypothetical protein